MAERIVKQNPLAKFAELDRAAAPAESAAGDDLVRIRQMVEWLSRWMDTAFELPVVGWRFGFDAIIGLVPGIGDAATTLVSLYILGLAHRAGVPRITLARMGLNVAIDFVLGSLPIVGDLFDVWWKANRMNADLLRIRLADPQHRSRKHGMHDWLFVGAIMLALVALLAVSAVITVWLATALWSACGGLLHSAR